MKKVLLLFMACLASMGGLAENGNVQLYDKGTKAPHPKSEIPTVKQEDQRLTLTSVRVITKAKVIIKNEKGEIVFEELVDITPDGVVLDIPSGFDEETYTIEIEYEQTALIGSFERMNAER